MRRQPTRVLPVLLAGVFGLSVPPAWGDGTEVLGPPSLRVADGNTMLAAGTGLVRQPGRIELKIPRRAEVKQVLLYWAGEMQTNLPGDDTIDINGFTVTGTLIGGPTLFYEDSRLGAGYASSFRADITDLGLVEPGRNDLTVTDLDFSTVANGAAVVAILDKGSKRARIDVRDGVDVAYHRFDEPRKSTVPQTFSFPSASRPRRADLSLLAGSVGVPRPNHIKFTFDGPNGGTEVVENPLASRDGLLWDSVNLRVRMPAGATMLSVQLVSTEIDDPDGASLVWVTAALAVKEPKPRREGGQGCSPGYWKQSHHFDSWVRYQPTDSYDRVFGVVASFDQTLLGALEQGGGKEKALGRQAVAALLNAATPAVSYSYSESQVIGIVQEAYDTGEFNKAKDRLERENQQGCPLN